MERDMLPWLEPQIEDERHTTKTTSANNIYTNDNGLKFGDVTTTSNECLTPFKSMLEVEWYLNNIPPHSEEVIPNLHIHTQQKNTNCPSDPNNFVMMQPSTSPSFLPPPKSNFSHLLNTNDNINTTTTTTTTTTNNNNNNDDHNHKNNPFGSVFNLESQSGFPTSFKGKQINLSNQGNLFGESFFNGPEPSNSSFFNKVEVSRPLEDLSAIFVPPTLIDKKEMCYDMGKTNKSGPLSISQFASTWLKEFESEMRMDKEGNKEGKGGLKHGSYEVVDIGKMMNNGNNGENDHNANYNDYGNKNNIVSNNGGGYGENHGAARDRKGKKKERSARSLMAEKRRREKLCDRMHTLRAIVPTISKMDKASILGDAVDYMKELQQQINDLQSELESNSPKSSLPPHTSFSTMTTATQTLPVQVKDELCHSNVSSLKNQSTKVEVIEREGGTLDIHVSCTHNSSLLLSTMRALDNLGLDVHQAVINCFNGFSVDVFKAKQYREGQKMLPEQIKAVLLNTLSFPDMM